MAEPRPIIVYVKQDDGRKTIYVAEPWPDLVSMSDVFLELPENVVPLVRRARTDDVAFKWIESNRRFEIAAENARAEYEVTEIRHYGFDARLIHGEWTPIPAEIAHG